MSDSHTNGDARQAFIGVDVGGTHTDVAVMYQGTVERGKALTTYDDFSRGVLEAVDVAARNYELGAGGAARQHQALHQRHDGRHQRHHAAARLARRRADHQRLPRRVPPRRRPAHHRDRRPPAAQRPRPRRPPRARRRSTSASTGRARCSCRSTSSRSRPRPRGSSRRSASTRSSICFLWSHANNEHELAAEAAIKELYPDLFVTPSHRVFPVEGETRRWTTAILNSFVQDRAEVYLTSLNEKLRAAGLAGGLAFFQGLGGGISLEKARAYPLGLLGSGPAGRRDRRQRAGQAHGQAARPARGHGRDEL